MGANPNFPYMAGLAQVALQAHVYGGASRREGAAIAAAPFVSALFDKAVTVKQLTVAMQQLAADNYRRARGAGSAQLEAAIADDLATWIETL